DQVAAAQVEIPPCPQAKQATFFETAARFENVPIPLTQAPNDQGKTLPVAALDAVPPPPIPPHGHDSDAIRLPCGLQNLRILHLRLETARRESRSEVHPAQFPSGPPLIIAASSTVPWIAISRPMSSPCSRKNATACS